MGVCDVLDGWDDAGPNSGRVDDVRGFVDELLESWGFDAPNWSDQMPAGYEDAAGVYTRNDDTIHLNPDIFEGDASDALNVAIHEGLHASMDQMGWNDPDLLEELMAAGAGYQALEDLVQGCQNPTESGAPSDMPSYPWVSSEG
ncbi:hypothetical protein [Marisediminicola antarctica]|uniref:Metallopeptidase domain-containing protein n=1 Tax=Marisediminicola antarctica TaxID=674079 RepID=A0A7L5AKW8_9MICO|nr:hypothetical protein [Marisediminicola antarctica]QHO69771.1 hypothetical protein BHD05_09070 [Marisediminicola antarctica]